MYNLIVKFDLNGFHCWPEAPKKYGRLASPHGHIFHFEVVVPVTEATRQIEFLEMRERLMQAFRDSYMKDDKQQKGPKLYCDFRGMSCEQLAESLARTCVNLYHVAPMKVVAMEDAFVGTEYVPGTFEVLSE